MDVINYILKPLSLLAEWASRQSAWVELTTMFAGIGAYSTALAGIVVSPLYLRMKHNEKTMKQTWAALDQRPTTIFNRVNTPAPKGSEPSAYQLAEKSAMKMARKIGNDRCYFDQQSCAQNHLHYYHDYVSRPHGVRNPVYIPMIVAFQAASDDPRMAVPLYSGPTEKTAIRGDGRKFTLN